MPLLSKSHAQLVGLFVEVSVNWTLSGAERRSSGST